MTKQQLGELIMAKKPAMWRISLSILGNETDCEDAIGNTVIKAFEGLDKLKQDRYAGTWLIRILINECHNIQRTAYARQQKEEPLDETLPSDNMVDQDLERNEKYSELYRAVNRLPEELKITVVLHYIEEYSVKEIAEMQDVPAGTVKSRLKRARDELKHLLKGRV